MALNRVEEFITKLTLLEDEQAIKTLCYLEVDYLRSELGIKPILNNEGYPVDCEGNATTLRKQLTYYRNAVRDLPATVNNSDRSVKKGQIVLTHKALKFLKLADYENDNANRQQLQRNLTDKGNRPSFDPVAVIEKALELLNSNSYISKVAGLYVLTGRRHGELMQSAKFSQTGLSCNLLTRGYEDSAYFALFEGQQKTSKKGQIKKVDRYGLTKQDAVPYKIPLLCPIELVQEQIEWLRKNHYQESGKRAKGSKELGQKVKKEFSNLLPDINPHKLRSVYTTMVWEIYKDSGEFKPTEDLFIDHVTGHSSETTESANAYMDYALDSNTANEFRAWFNELRLEKVAEEWL